MDQWTIYPDGDGGYVTLAERSGMIGKATHIPVNNYLAAMGVRHTTPVYAIFYSKSDDESIFATRDILN